MTTTRRVIYPASTPRTLLLVAAPQQQPYTIRRPIASADTKPATTLGKRKASDQYVDILRDSDGESDCESESTNTYSHDEIEIEDDMKMYEQKTIDGAPVRKRERLTHLSPEEKMWRRKMKNRIAAQTARDRKKARMDDIEDAVKKLERQNRNLAAENASLRKQNEELMAKMNAIERNATVDATINTPMNTTVESAARTGCDIGTIDNSTLHICDIDLQRIIDDLLRDAPVEGAPGEQQQHVDIAHVLDTTTEESSCYEYTSTDGETSSSSSFTTNLDDITQQIDDDNILQQTHIQDVPHVPHTPPSAMLLLDADLIDINRCFDEKSLQDNNNHLYSGSPVWNEDFSDLFDIVN